MATKDTMSSDSSENLAWTIYNTVVGLAIVTWQYPEAQLFSYIFMGLAALPIVIFLLFLVGVTFGLVAFLVCILIGVKLSVVILSLFLLVPVLIVCFWIAVAAFVTIFIGIKLLHVAADFSGPNNEEIASVKSNKAQ